MISVKELRVGNIVKDNNGRLWRVGCVTGFNNNKPSVVLERHGCEGIIKWYSDENDVIPIAINDNLLDIIGFKRDKERDVYRGYGISIEVFDNEYYIGLRDLEDDFGDSLQVKTLHQLQNILIDLYEYDMINIEKLYDYTGK